MAGTMQYLVKSSKRGWVGSRANRTDAVILGLHSTFDGAKVELWTARVIAPGVLRPVAPDVANAEWEHLRCTPAEAHS